MERRILTVRWYCVQNYLWHANHCTILNQIVVRIELFTYYHWARCTVVTGLEMCVWCSIADEAYGVLTLFQVTSSPLEYIGPVSQQDHRSGPVRNQAERYRLLQCESSLNAQFSSQRSRNLTNYTSTNTNTEPSLFSMWLQTKHLIGGTGLCLQRSRLSAASSATHLRPSRTYACYWCEDLGHDVEFHVIPGHFRRRNISRGGVHKLLFKSCDQKTQIIDFQRYFQRISLEALRCKIPPMS